MRLQNSVADLIDFWFCCWIVPSYVHLADKSRHTPHPDLHDPAPLNPGLYADEAARGLELEAGGGLGDGKLPRLQEGGHHADGVVAGEQGVDTVLLSDNVAWRNILHRN